MIFPEHRLAHRLLDGLNGLEIGAAAHNPFGLRTRNVAPPDDFEFYSSYSQSQGITPRTVDIWAMADKIPIADSSEDFVISSHVVEHIPNIVAALLEWNRVVRAGGIIFMIVPLRDAHPHDTERAITPLTHYVEDYYRQLTLDTHPLEGFSGKKMGHYHVFTADSLLAVVGWMQRKRLCDWELVAREDIDTKVGNGFTLAFRVVSKFPRPEPPPLAEPLNSLEICQEIIAEQSREISFQWDKAPCIATAEEALDRVAAVERCAMARKELEAVRQELVSALIDLASCRASLTACQAELQTIRTSGGWKFLSVYYRVRNFLVPRSSYRWQAARSVLSAAMFLNRFAAWLRRKSVTTKTTAEVYCPNRIPAEANS